MGGSPIFGFPHRPAGTKPISSADAQGIVGALQQLLNQNSDQKYELINLGINGGRSSDTRTLFRRAQEWDIDVVLIYDGNNEFFHIPSTFSPILWRSALYRFFVTSQQPPPVASSITSPSPYGGWKQEKAVEEEFSRTLGNIIDLAKSANIQPIVISQALNRTGYDPTWSAEGPLDEKTVRIKELRQTYPKSASIAWEWWKKQYEQGVWDEQALVDSVEYDALRLRARQSIQDIIQNMAKEKEIKLIDVYTSMKQYEQNHLELFYDWVHPTPTGAYYIAHTIAERILDRKIELSNPSSEDNLEALHQIAMIWLRAACIKEYDPEFRLNQARVYAQKILILQPKDELASSVLKITDSWDKAGILLSPDMRPIFKQQGTCLAAKVR